MASSLYFLTIMILTILIMRQERQRLSAKPRREPFDDFLLAMAVLIFVNAVLGIWSGIMSFTDPDMRALREMAELSRY